MGCRCSQSYQTILGPQNRNKFLVQKKRGADHNSLSQKGDVRCYNNASDDSSFDNDQQVFDYKSSDYRLVNHSTELVEYEQTLNATASDSPDDKRSNPRQEVHSPTHLLEKL